MKVLVTGANGFLGRHVVAALVRRGHEVRAMVRPAAMVFEPGWDRVELFRADLRVAKNLADAFAGVDVLIHLAAGMTGDDETRFAHTVVGTERLLTAMTTTTTKRLVLASSFSVYDWSAICGTLDENSPLEADLYTRDGYAIAKVWQERVARRFAEQHGWGLTVLRPGFIWGRDHFAEAGIGQGAGPVQLVIGPQRVLPLTHVENCGDLFAAAATDERATGQTFNVVDPEPISAWRFAGVLQRRGAIEGILAPAPYWFGNLVAHTAQRIARLVFGPTAKLPSVLVPCRFEARFKPLRFAAGKAESVLGWKAPLTFEHCVERSFNDAVVPAAPTPIPAPASTRRAA